MHTYHSSLINKSHTSTICMRRQDSKVMGGWPKKNPVLTSNIIVLGNHHDDSLLLSNIDIRNLTVTMSIQMTH